MARGGVEPPTFRFSVGRSYQLSYLAAPAATGVPRAEHTIPERSGPHGIGARVVREAFWRPVGGGPMLIPPTRERGRAPIV